MTLQRQDPQLGLGLELGLGPPLVLVSAPSCFAMSGTARRET